MVQVNKKLQQRVSYYQEKSKGLIGDYENIMASINSVFKKTEDYLVSSHQVTSTGTQQKNSVQNLQELSNLVRLKLNFLFSSEMEQLKHSFETLQKKFYDITSQTFTLQPFSTYINSFDCLIQNSEVNSNIDCLRESSNKSPIPSSTDRSYNSYVNRLNTLNEYNNTVTSQCSNSITQRSLYKPPISLREHSTSRHDSLGKDSKADSSFTYKPQKRGESILNSSIVERLHTIHTSLKPSLKDRIEDIIKPAISTNHSRHNSLSYFTSASHPGASTRCSSTKASNQSNMISPTSNSIILAESIKEKSLADFQKKEASREASRHNTPNRSQTPYTRIQPQQKTTIPERHKTSTRLRVNEILSSNKENSCCNSFTIPTLDIKNLVTNSKDNSRRSVQNRELEPQIVQKSPRERLSTRDAYSHLKSFRKLVKDFHTNPVTLPFNDQQIDEKDPRNSKGSILKRNPQGFTQK